MTTPVVIFFFAVNGMHRGRILEDHREGSWRLTYTRDFGYRRGCCKETKSQPPPQQQPIRAHICPHAALVRGLIITRQIQTGGVGTHQRKFIIPQIRNGTSPSRPRKCRAPRELTAVKNWHNGSMNFKACCGLLGGRDDEDYDYEDVEQDPLPKPQSAADLTRKKVCTSQSARPQPKVRTLGSSHEPVLLLVHAEKSLRTPVFCVQARRYIREKRRSPAEYLLFLRDGPHKPVLNLKLGHGFCCAWLGRTGVVNYSLWRAKNRNRLFFLFSHNMCVVSVCRTRLAQQQLPIVVSRPPAGLAKRVHRQTGGAKTEKKQVQAFVLNFSACAFPGGEPGETDQYRVFSIPLTSPCTVCCRRQQRHTSGTRGAARGWPTCVRADPEKNDSRRPCCAASHPPASVPARFVSGVS